MSRWPRPESSRRPRPASMVLAENVIYGPWSDSFDTRFLARLKDRFLKAVPRAPVQRRYVGDLLMDSSQGYSRAGWHYPLYRYQPVPVRWQTLLRRRV